VPRDWEHSITGVESGVLIQEWLAGDAAASLTTFKISDVTRAPRLTGVELQSAACEEKTRSITRREMIGEWVRSRCPFGAWQLRGALFVESIRRLASGSEVQRAGVRAVHQHCHARAAIGASMP
jgi:hypothetical protein